MLLPPFAKRTQADHSSDGYECPAALALVPCDGVTLYDLYNPFRIALRFLGTTLLQFQVFCPQNGTDCGSKRLRVFFWRKHSWLTDQPLHQSLHQPLRQLLHQPLHQPLYQPCYWIELQSRVGDNLTPIPSEFPPKTRHITSLKYSLVCGFQK